MSDIGNQIERGSEGPEWVEHASNRELRKEVECLQAEHDDAQAAARWLFSTLATYTDIFVRNDALERWPSLAASEVQDE